MRWDEERYGREYDLDTFMIFCADDFNMGAMENKGLNIFNSKLLLANPETATDADYSNIEGVIAHEYFHNWTGNRVTCRDWFQLSLKEGLTVFRDQEYSSDVGSRAVERIEAVDFLRAQQFAEDAGPMAHPVRPDSYAEINNFYTATVYEKGAEVIRMQHTLLGDASASVAAWICTSNDTTARRSPATISCRRCRTASGIDLAQFRLWYSQAGTPTLAVKGDYDAAAQTFTLERRAIVPAYARPAGQAPVPHSAGGRACRPRRKRSAAASGWRRQGERELGHHGGAARDGRHASRFASSTSASLRCLRCCADSRRRSRSTTTTARPSWSCSPRTIPTL